MTSDNEQDTSPSQQPNHQAGAPLFAPPAIASASQVPKGPSKKWLIITLVFSFLTVAPIIIYILVIMDLSKKAQEGMAGTEFVAFGLLPLLLLVPLFLLTDFILSIVYIVKQKPRGIKLALPIGIMLTIVSLIGYTGWSIYYETSGKANEHFIKTNTISRADAIERINNCEVISVNRELSAEKTPYILPSNTASGTKSKYYINEKDLAAINDAARNAPEKCGQVKTTEVHNLQRLPVTIEEATDILNSCQVIGFYYPHSSDEDELSAKLALDETGLYLVSDGDNKPIRIHTSSKTIDAMAPIARKAQETCPDLQFWNGTYEYRDTNGNWVLREPSNTAQ